MSNPNDFNQAMIAEFRANGGKVGGHFVNTPLVLLNTIGAKSGQPRTNPLAYVTDGDRILVIASKAGAHSHPDWYYNLLAHPLVNVELGSEKFQARATAITEGPERDRLYTLMVARNPGFAEYQEKTNRTIPAVLLERLG